jgi:hypothetical protein
MIKTKRKRLRGIVQQVLRPFLPSEPEKEDAEDLYREVRIENVLTNENGEKVGLKPGADVDVVVEADTDATTKITE